MNIALQSSHLDYLGVGKLMIEMVFAWVSDYRAMFLSGIKNIVQLTPKEKVVRVNTGGVVALMKHKNTSVRHGSVGDEPRRPVRSDIIVVDSSILKSSVSPFVHASSPKPARSKMWNVIGYWSIPIHFGPESFFKWRLKHVKTVTAVL